jgi:hypothetical protein
MRCDECRHWKALDDWSARWSGLGECGAVREQWVVEEDATKERELGWAENEDDWDEYGEAPPPPNSWTGVRMAALKEAKAVVMDGSSYMAELRTTGDFFCALFEAKP